MIWLRIYAIKILVYAIVGMSLFILSLRYLERKSIFFPSRIIEFTPSLIGLGFEDVYFVTEDNLKLNGWFIEASKEAPVLLFLHGNAGNISHRLDKLKMFSEMGVNIFIIDYRGYGRSEGAPSEEGIYKDAQAAYKYLLEKRGIAPKKIIAYGESVGGVAAIDLAAKKEAGGLIIDSSFSSAKDMAKKFYPFIPSFLLKTKMDSVSKIKNVTCPKLFIHSIDDEIVAFDLAKKLFDAAREPKTFVKIRGGHNDGFILDQETYTAGIKEFFKTIGI